MLAVDLAVGMLPASMRIGSGSVLLVSTLAVAGIAPSIASADDCMCALVELSPTAGSQDESFLNSAPVVSQAISRADAVSEGSSGDDAVSLPVDAIASLPSDLTPSPNFVRGVPGDLAHLAERTNTQGGETVLWCEGGDDPRCEEDSAPNGGDLFAPVPGLVAKPDLATQPRETSLLRPGRESVPSDGVYGTLYRPPRG